MLIFNKLKNDSTLHELFIDQKTKSLIIKNNHSFLTKDIHFLNYINFTLDLIFIPKKHETNAGDSFCNTLLNSFISNLKQLLKGFNQHFFFEFKIIGLGYKLFKIKKSFSTKMIGMKLGFAHYFQYIIPSNLRLVNGKRRLLMFSNDYEILKNICKHFFFLKRLNVYKLKGLIPTKAFFRLKIKQKK